MSTLAGEFIWTPPEAMERPVAASWRTFYRHVFGTYGLTPEAYRAIYLAQLGRCFICRKAKGVHPDDPKGRGYRRLGVDHVHALGYSNPMAVRGLLCSGGDKTCNRIIGWLNQAGLLRAAEFVETMPARSVLARLTEPYTDEDISGMLVSDWRQSSDDR